MLNMIMSFPAPILAVPKESCLAIETLVRIVSSGFVCTSLIFF